MSNSISTKMTFLELIKDHIIVVPIIQRDYVQGRESSDVNEIRKDFLEEILKSLTNKIPPINLGFIYGKVLDKDYQIVKKKNKEAIEGVLNSLKDYAKHLDEEITFAVDWSNKLPIENEVGHSKFIPLDGQQRLTTLYLIHWYILHQTKQKANNHLILKSFKYTTRKQTQEFIDALINEEFDLKGETILSSQVEKKTWFLHQWLHDPSVKAMLNTLNSIHTLFNEQDFHLLWKSFEEGCVTFDYLDLDQLQQTDEIYVKMNARGKQLSDFEHFKAWLQSYIKDSKNSISINIPKWEDKLDIDWLDLFWNNNKVETTDDSFLMFFQHIGFSKFATRPETVDKKPFYNKIKSTKYEDRFISIDDNSVLFNSDELNHVFSALAFLHDCDFDKYNASIAKVIGRDFKLNKTLLDGKIFERLSQNDEIIIHGILLYGIKAMAKNIPFDANNFEQWLRVVRNLAANTFIQGFENFIDALKSIQQLSNHCFEIEKQLLKPKFSIDFFYGDQQKEEKLKVKKFQISHQWREEIIIFENHNYFNGQIGFFFDILEPDEQDDIDAFILYGEKLSYLFSEVLDKKYSTFQASLLACVDYSINRSSKWSFLDKKHNDLRTRFDNWRKVFRKNEKSSGDNIPFDGLKDLVRDSRTYDVIKNTSKIKDWRYIFIKNKALIEYCENNLFSYNSEIDIQLLKGTTFTGKSVDAYLYFLLKRIEKGCNVIKIELLEINGRKNKGNVSEIIFTLNDNKTILRLSYIPDDKLVRFELKIETLYKSAFTDKAVNILTSCFLQNSPKKYSLEMVEDKFMNNQELEMGKIVNCFVELDKLEL